MSGFDGLSYLLAALIALAIICFDRLDGIPYLIDVDDMLRALQVRQLVENGGWYDRGLPMIAMPEPYVSPWSRLVDLPYWVIAIALKPLVGLDAALRIAFHLWPPLMLVAYIVLVIEVIRALVPSGHTLEPLALVAAILTMMLPILEFTPGRIDHHNVQLLLFMGLFWGVVRWRRGGAVVAGIAAVLSVAVGLEMLPLVAVVLIAVSLCWVLDRPGSRSFASILGLTIAIAAPLAGLLLIGPRESAATVCDAFSAPYISALVGYGVVMSGATAVMAGGGRVRRLTMLGVAAVALIGLLAHFFPSCLQGPYQMVDPISRSLWLDRLNQERSVLVFFQLGEFAPPAILGTFIVLLVLALPSLAEDWRRSGSGNTIVFAVAVAVLMLAIAQTRYIRFSGAFVALFAPAAIHLPSLRPRALLLAGGTAVVLGIAGIGAHLAFPVQRRSPDAVDHMAAVTCGVPDMSDLATLPPGRILAPAPLGMHMAGRLPPGMSIGAIPFHRAAPGMRRMFEAFIQDDGAARRAALAPFDYLATCRFPVPESISGDHLYAALARGEGWPGLVSLPDVTRGDLLFFRIDHPALR